MAVSREFTVTGQDQIKARMRALPLAIRGPFARTALRAGATVISNRAKELAPVLTGNLRRSIAVTDGDGEFVHIGTDVEYAIYQEFGTSKMAAQPFLRPAFDEMFGQAQVITGKVLWKLIEAAA